MFGQVGDERKALRLDILGGLVGVDRTPVCEAHPSGLHIAVALPFVVWVSNRNGRIGDALVGNKDHGVVLIELLIY